MKRLWISKYFLITVIVILTAALSACTSAPTPTPSITPTPTPVPTISITSPKNTAILIPGNITVSVEVSNFTLVDKLGQPSVPGEGHIHYFLDVDPPTTPGQPAVTAPGTYAPTAATSYTWPNVTAGSHKFSVELVNDNHTPLVPPVVASVTVNVTPEIGQPNIVIVSPGDGANLPAGDVTVTVQVSNFNLVDKLGQPTASKEGHIHYFKDVDAPTTPGQPAVTAPGTYAPTAATSYTWPNVTAGTHTFSAELINNDHTPLTPPVVVKITVTVQATTPSPSPTPTPSPTPGPSVTINLTAQYNTFNLSTITVTSGASVTINFTNNDSGIPHNFALYTDSSASNVIFRGDIISGISTAVYTFAAPTTPGTYFFRCDPHPTQMTGSFVVTAVPSNDGGSGY